MKISEEDLKNLFDSGEQPNANSGERVELKKIKTTHEIKNIRKTLRHIKTSRPKSDFSEYLNSILRFLAIAGLTGFMIFIVMGWGGFSKQLQWGYFVTYLNEAVPTATPTPKPAPATTQTINEPVATPNLLPSLIRPSVPDEANNRLTIEKIGVASPVFWDIEEAVILDQLKEGVAHYKGTAHPGEGGNIFIVGHSSNYIWIRSDYNNIFALLDKLTPGDRIILTHKNQKYTYEVKITNIVKPEDVQVLENTPKETLSLMTCWPLGTSLKRMVVQAELLYTE